jgi:hypothetical protein
MPKKLRCSSIGSKRVRSPEKHRKDWEARIFRTYGLKSEDVARQWETQEGRCPICLRSLSSLTWVIDHSHKTKQFRGLLCSWCNHKIVSMAERGGKLRWENVGPYLGWAQRIVPSNSRSLQTILPSKS